MEGQRVWIGSRALIVESLRRTQNRRPYDLFPQAVNFMQKSYAFAFYKLSVIQMSAVTDPVDRYRHGVLIGNYVEDKFGADLLSQERSSHQNKLATTKDHHSIAHSLYQPHPLISQKEAVNNSFYQTSKQAEPTQYRRPESETSYHIFHRQQVVPSVPIVLNDPKREHNLAKEGKLYEDTRYYLANKFEAREGSKEAQQALEREKWAGESLRETGNIGAVDNQEIPDILTGQIWRAANKKPGADSQNSSKANGEPTVKIGQPAQAKSINPFGATSIVKPQVARFDEEVYKRYVMPHEKGQERDVLFGHGLDLDDFKRRQLATTYDLSFNQRIKPQTQVNSFYQPDHYQTAKKFHRETLLEKKYQERIPEYGSKAVLSQEKVERPYNPYTKTFDQNHLKHEYLRQ